MATIINNPTDAGRVSRVERIEHTDSSAGTGFLVGVILAILLGILLLAYGLPNFRSSAPAINVPESVDVNVNPGSGSVNTTPAQ